MDALTPGATDLIDRLSAAGADAVGRGLILASGGNLSARIPGTDTFVVTAKGTWLDRLTVDDFALLDVDGTRLNDATPSSEWKLHARTYAVRPDAASIFHLHPQMSVLLTALGHPIRLMTLDHAFYVRSVGQTPYYPNGSDELADSAAEQAKQHDCIVMGHHGCSAIGDSVEMAYRRALNLEQAAQTTFHALQLGDTTTSFPADELGRLHHA